VSVLGLGAVGGGAWALHARAPLASSPVVSVENSPPVVSPVQIESPSAEPTPVEPAAAAPSQEDKVAAPDPAPRAAVSSHKVPSPSSASSLAAQTDLLDKAHAALDARHPAAALQLLADYDKTYPGGILIQEASALRIEALYDTGHSPEAAALADRFLTAYPSSSHAEHVRALRRDHAPSAGQ
jgi:TolA-binding protein